MFRAVVKSVSPIIRKTYSVWKMPRSTDHIFRENVAPVFEVFVREVLGVRPLSSVRVELAQPKTSERVPDYLRKVVLRANSAPVILHIEFQTKPDPKMHLRMLEYNALLRRRFEMDVHQYVLLLSGSRDVMVTRVQGEKMYFSYELIHLGEIDFDLLVATEKPELIVAAVLSDFGNREVVGVIRRIFVTLRAQIPDERELQKYLTQLEILSNLRDGYNEIVIEEIKNMAFTFNLEADGRYKQGVQQGIQKGFEQGATEKQQQIARESLLNGGTVEFTAKVTGLSLKQVRGIKSRLDTE